MNQLSEENQKRIAKRPLNEKERSLITKGDPLVGDFFPEIALGEMWDAIPEDVLFRLDQYRYSFSGLIRVLYWYGESKRSAPSPELLEDLHKLGDMAEKAVEMRASSPSPTSARENRKETVSEEKEFSNMIVNLLRHFLWNIKRDDPAAEERAFEGISKEIAFRAWAIIEAVYEGAEEWKAKYNSLASSPTSGIGWVKASERLPTEDGKPICFKMNGGYFTAYVYEFKNNTRQVCNIGHQIITHWKTGEWLEESPSSSLK